MTSTETKWQKDFSEEALAAEIAQAKTVAQQAETTEPCAKNAYYDGDCQLMVIELTNGAIFSFPPHLAQGLQQAIPEQLNDCWLDASGRSIHWRSLDVDFSIAGLMTGIFGTQTWMKEIGRRVGQAKSSAKQQAARANGKKGGRPLKTATIEDLFFSSEFL
ncbi:DUF2442 domain-containing protein [Synechococcus sp. BDU 130192]|uniref:DUF2442 domain-containing protein n=1 Tax=Synechococcus sp. BDU 130192 TaxID=2042059 RepID=UPI000C084489|nr:DUF2442 domain-containing protein [Synechococcus sp. BDU 130192]